MKQKETIYFNNRKLNLTHLEVDKRLSLHIIQNTNKMLHLKEIRKCVGQSIIKRVDKTTLLEYLLVGGQF